MSSGAGDGSLWQISQAIANCEGFYLQGLDGVDDLASFSPVVPNTIGGAYPSTLGVYLYTQIKPYTQQGTIGGTGPLQLRCHYFQRLVVVGARSDNMEDSIDPQLQMWVDYYVNMVSAHQTLREPLWQPDYRILPDVIVVPTASNSTHAYQNRTGAAFTTGSTEPIWNTGSGSTTLDGTGTWTEIRAPWGAVSNWAKVTKSEVFSITTQEGLAQMGVAFTIEATAFPATTIGL